ncbi:hypothetical protein pf16_122 [Pseudomonas phage pf16]|uniref:Uncharacterized protein n=1 Tax=Pseudomonas phage pf16 TaxID=1815630 RepID=A0A1S5R3Z3_9CAUD|nr:hypothetical protein FDG98_gp176 [Pseudomonas phage pf16]AND75045.1 hypothetical protein pf16_122 [Pseudomonas phage pf16]
MDLLLVEGNPGLRKDAQTGAVINNDREALLAARRLKEQRLAEINKVNELEDKVAKMELLLKQLLGEKADD